MTFAYVLSDNIAPRDSIVIPDGTPHCQQCGSTSDENLNTGFDPDYQGYTRCCNERNVNYCTPRDCDH